MISTLAVMLLLLGHFFGDFVLQTHWMASNKSKSLKALLAHTFTYTLVFGIILAHPGQAHLAVYFLVITFVLHTSVDFVTSRITSRLFAKGVKARTAADDRRPVLDIDGKALHNFFLTIGLDQYLHALSLIVTYRYLWP